LDEEKGPRDPVVTADEIAAAAAAVEVQAKNLPPPLDKKTVFITKLKNGDLKKTLG